MLILKSMNILLVLSFSLVDLSHGDLGLNMGTEGCPEGANVDKEFRCFSFRESLSLPISKIIGLKTISRRLKCNEIRNRLRKLGTDWANDRCKGGVTKATVVVSNNYYGSPRVDECYSYPDEESASLTVLCNEGEAPLGNLERRKCGDIKIISFETLKSKDLGLMGADDFNGLQIIGPFGLRTFPDHELSSICPNDIALSSKAGGNVTLPTGCSILLNYPYCSCSGGRCVRKVNNEISPDSSPEPSNEKAIE